MLAGKDKSVGIEISGMEMSGIEMSGMEMSGMEMSGIEMSGIEMSGTEMSGIVSFEVAALGSSSFLSLLHAEIPSIAAAPKAKTATDFIEGPFGVRERSLWRMEMSEQGLQILGC